MRQTIISAMVISGLLLAGCSSSPDSIQATYVSPLEYKSYDCDQIAQEMRRVGLKVQEVAGDQAEEATGDAVAVAAGVLVFWPALFFLMGDDREEELARLKGEAEALEQAAIDKKCTTLLEDIDRERKKAEEKKRERVLIRLTLQISPGSVLLSDTMSPARRPQSASRANSMPKGSLSLRSCSCFPRPRGPSNSDGAPSSTPRRPAIRRGLQHRPSRQPRCDRSNHGFSPRRQPPGRRSWRLTQEQPAARSARTYHQRCNAGSFPLCAGLRA